MRPGTARPRWSATWLGLLIACAGTLTLVEAVLIELTHHVFSGGFLATQPLRSAAAVAGFAIGSLAIDALLVLGAWLLVLPLLRRIRLTLAQEVVGAAALGLAGPLLFDTVRFQLVRNFGDLLDVDLLLALAGNSPLEWLAQSSSHALPLALGVLGVGIAAVVVVRALRRVGRSGADPGREPPALRALALALTALLAFDVAALIGLCLPGSAVCSALVRKPGGLLLRAAIVEITDLDRDGSGLLSRVPDPAPLDASIHPYALDYPGNGIDENAVGGDHPIGFRPPILPAGPPPRWTRRPHVLLILLESFRGDMLETRVNGREVTPFMNRLGLEGASSRHAYVTSPYTVKSRAQLFGGRPDPYPGQSTLVDDFAANGYRVAWLSAQDDSFGGTEDLLGLERTDFFYDARSDPDKRSSRFSTAGSLSVPWKVLNARIKSFLETADLDVPHLIYVNYHDTHFPYHHAQLDDVLGVEPLERGKISPATRERLWETYANSAANVDRAVQRMIEDFRERIGGAEHSIVIAADHGQSLFERGFLGHGLSLTDDQTRIPLVIWGVGGDWPEPISLADVRGLLQQNLSIPGDGAAPQPRLVAPPGRQIFQYMAHLDRPRLLGLRALDDALFYDRKLGTLEVVGRDGEPRDATPEEIEARFELLIDWWEALALEEAAHSAQPGPRSDLSPRSPGVAARP